MKLTIIALAGTLAASAASVSSNVTYYKDVAPVLQNRCQECHRSGEVAPMSFTSYDETRPWAKAIKTAVLTKKMPPWLADPKFDHFQNARRLTDFEINTLVSWVDAGAPEGDAHDKPARRVIRQMRSALPVINLRDVAAALVG